MRGRETGARRGIVGSFRQCPEDPNSRSPCEILPLSAPGGQIKTIQPSAPAIASQEGGAGVLSLRNPPRRARRRRPMRGSDLGPRCLALAGDPSPRAGRNRFERHSQAEISVDVLLSICATRRYGCDMAALTGIEWADQLSRRGSGARGSAPPATDVTPRSGR
jgi:hypothetical protein